MSLFGSIYEDAGAGDDAPVDAPVDAPDAPTSAAEVDAPIEVPDVPDVPLAMPDEPLLGAPAMSLQDFAAEVFGTRGESAGPSPLTPDALDGAEPESAFATRTAGVAEVDSSSGLESPAEPVESPFAITAAPAEAGTSLATLAEADTVVAPAEPASLSTDTLPPGNDGATLGTIPNLEPWDAYQDDLLPGRPGRGSRSLPKLSVGGSRPLKILAVVALAVVAGLYGVKTLTGGSGDEAVPERQAAGTDKNVVVGPGTAPGNLGETIGAAQLAGAEAELRTAALQASAHFAEAGSFAQPAEAWQSLLVGSTVAAATGSPQQNVLQVSSDDDAVCFETLTGSGTTVAVGVTADALGFASDASGGAVCTTDAATLAGWVPSLIVPAG